MSFKEAVELAYSVHTRKSKRNFVSGCSTCNIFMKCTATILTFSFMDPVEEVLLTELDDAFISRVSFRAVAELVYSVPSENIRISGFFTCSDLMKMYFHSNYLHRFSRGSFAHRTG